MHDTIFELHMAVFVNFMPVKKRHSKKKKNTSNQTIMLTKSVKILSRKYSRITKVTGARLRSDFVELAQCPRTHTPDDWILVNAVEFLDRVEVLFSSCSLFCTVSTCPLFNAGPHYHYLWDDEDTPQPVQLSAPEYFVALKRWVKRNLSNEKLFPVASGTPLSEAATDILRTTYRRLFRILAHMYMCHFSNIRKSQMEVVLNTMLGHYTTLALQYGMIDPADLEMLRPVFQAMGMDIEGMDGDE